MSLTGIVSRASQLLPRVTLCTCLRYAIWRNHRGEISTKKAEIGRKAPAPNSGYFDWLCPRLERLTDSCNKSETVAVSLFTVAFAQGL